MWKIGEGSFGTVYNCNGKIYKSFENDEEFNIESITLNTLKKNNIDDKYNKWKTDTNKNIIMPKYNELPNVDIDIKEKNKIVIQLIKKISKLIDYELFYVYVKPDNIKMDKDKNIVLIDIGSIYDRPKPEEYNLKHCCVPRPYYIFGEIEIDNIYDEENKDYLEKKMKENNNKTELSLLLHDEINIDNYIIKKFFTIMSLTNTILEILFGPLPEKYSERKEYYNKKKIMI